jgi:hypothetical protein
MVRRWRVWGVALAICVGCLASAPAAGAWIYWGHEGYGVGIGRAGLDATQPNESFIPVAPGVYAFMRGVAVDSNYVYWGQHGLNTKYGDSMPPPVIGRAPLSGAGPEYAFTAAAGGGITSLGYFGSNVFWTAANTDTTEIGYTAASGGQGVHTVSSKFGAPNPKSCGVATDGEYVYWANPETASIGREKLSTFGTKEPSEGQWIQLSSSFNEFVHPCGVAVDGKYVYWGIKEITIKGVANRGTTIGRALKAEGGEATNTFAGGGNEVTGLAIDGAFLYTSNFGDGLPGHGSIGRASLAGGGGDANFVSGLTDPFGVAVDAGGPGAPPPSTSIGGYVPPLVVGCAGCGGGATGGSNVPADFSRVWTTNPVFAPAPWSTPGYAVAKTAAAARGTIFNYIIDKPGTVTILITGSAPGKRIGRKCVAPTRRNAGKRACTRVVTYATLTRLSKAGHNETPFSGRIGGRALKPGRYKATFISKAATGTATRSSSLSFKLVAR